VLARELTSKGYCPRSDGGDREWPPRGTLCDNPGKGCSGCIPAWLEQPNAEEVKTLRRVVERAADCLWDIPSFCPGRKSEGWSLLWCGGRRANSCGACIAAWLKRPEPEEPVKAGPAVSRDGEWQTGPGRITLSRKFDGDWVLNLRYDKSEIELDTPAVVALAKALRCVPVPAESVPGESVPRKSRA